MRVRITYRHNGVQQARTIPVICKADAQMSFWYLCVVERLTGTIEVVDIDFTPEGEAG